MTSAQSFISRKSDAPICISTTFTNMLYNIHSTSSCSITNIARWWYNYNRRRTVSPKRIMMVYRTLVYFSRPRAYQKSSSNELL